MHIESGQIVQIEELLNLPPEERTKFFQMEKLPDEDCPRCDGKGYIGRNKSTGLIIPCPCIGKPPEGFSDLRKLGKDLKNLPLAKARVNMKKLKEQLKAHEQNRPIEDEIPA